MPYIDDKEWAREQKYIKANTIASFVLLALLGVLLVLAIVHVEQHHQDKQREQSIPRSS